MDGLHAALTLFLIAALARGRVHKRRVEKLENRCSRLKWEREYVFAECERFRLDFDQQCERAHQKHMQRSAN
jgi:hypothetical protein